MMNTYQHVKVGLLGLSLLMGPAGAAKLPEPVVIHDPVVLACVRDKLGLAEDVQPNRQQLEQIEYLNCDHRTAMRQANLREFAALPNLVSLNLSATGMTDLHELSELQNLHTLFLNDNGLSDEDIQVLHELPGLQTLMLANNQLTQVEVLAGLTQLKELDLKHNQLVDTQPLKALPKLLWLDISYNCMEQVPTFNFIDAYKWGQLKPGQCPAGKP
ncbi:MAG: leucine-rich repeat domain-containing protein [Thiolinea sp.]